ncbi:MAG: hypothetical protein ACP5EP_09495 [Acidobacteriaceae bacterium]
MPGQPSSDDAVSLVTLEEYLSLDEALLVQGLLASYGIGAVLEDENFLRLYGGWVHSHSGIPLQVRKVDVEAAREILDESQQPFKMEESEQP